MNDNNQNSPHEQCPLSNITCPHSDLIESIHDYMSLQIEKQKISEQRWNNFINSFLGAIAVSAVGILMWIGQLVLDNFKHN